MEVTGGLEKNSFRDVVRVLVLEWKKRDWTSGYMKYFQGFLPKRNGKKMSIDQRDK